MTIKNFTIAGLTNLPPSFVTRVLNGLGQIMLQENPLTGFLFLAGICYGSLVMGAAALLATVCGTATAILLNYDHTKIDKGLYGFSAALVGVATVSFLKPVFVTWVMIIIGSALTTVLQHFFIKRTIPVFTLPFVLVTWAILFLVNQYAPAWLEAPSVSALSTGNYFTFAIKGFGQVIFQDSLVSGLLFFIAVLISSPIAALYGLAGAVVSGSIASYWAVPDNDISMGLFSYNAVLCAIVFAGNCRKDGVWVLFSVLLSIAISLFMFQRNLIQLTFPFVLASFLTLLVKNKVSALTQSGTRKSA